MTRQTEAPLTEFRKDTKHTTMRELVRLLDDGWLTLTAPYQRGDVWTEDQRIALIRSWMTGVPIPSIITNDRTSPWWKGVRPTETALIAAIDGRQRIVTGHLWFSGELAVPATWFPTDMVDHTEDTDDGPYVRYAGLTRPMQTSIAFTWTVPVVEAKVGTITEEAAIYLLVNGAGTPQSTADMDNATRVAQGE